MPEEKKERKIPCDIVVRTLKEKILINIESRRKVERLSEEFVGKDYFEYERVFGKGPWSVSDIVKGLYREIERGNVRVEDGKLCRFGNCIDQKELFENLYKYFSTSYEIGQTFPLIMECEV